MSITITYSTMDHRYFMRRTKSEIIARIGDLRGNHVTGDERREMVNWPKWRLVDEAMRLVRTLPAPPDPVDVLVGVIQTELRRQSSDEGIFISDDSTEPIIDGRVDLKALAQAIIKGTAA